MESNASKTKLILSLIIVLIGWNHAHNEKLQCNHPPIQCTQQTWRDTKDSQGKKNESAFHNYTTLSDTGPDSSSPKPTVDPGSDLTSANPSVSRDECKPTANKNKQTGKVDCDESGDSKECKMQCESNRKALLKTHKAKKCLNDTLDYLTGKENANLSGEESHKIFSSYLDTLESYMQDEMFTPMRFSRQYLNHIEISGKTVNKTTLESFRTYRLTVSGNEMQIPWKTLRDLGADTDENIKCAFAMTEKLDLFLTQGSSYLNSSMVNLSFATQPDTQFSLGSNVLTGLLNLNASAPFTLPITFLLLHTKNKTANATRGCAYWQPRRWVWADDGCNTREHNETHTKCECNHLTSFVILLASSDQVVGGEGDPSLARNLDILTYMGLPVSMVGLLISCVTFLKCKSIQGDRNTVHLHLSLCLLLAYLTFLVLVDSTGNQVLCLCVAMLLHYLFLTVFAWMLLEGVVLYLMVVTVFHVARLGRRYMYLVAYGLPAVVVAVSASMHTLIYETEKYCWVAATQGAIWSFAGPVCCVVLINLIIFSVTLWKLSQNISSLAPNSSTLKKIRLFVGTAIAQLFILGFTWIFGIIHIIQPYPASAYLFVFTNVFQGASIFICHCLLNKKVRAEYRKFFASICHCKKSKEQSTSMQTTSLPQ